MTLTTHAIVGAAIVSIVPTHPELGLALAFASHFAMDAIPHWSYGILSDSMNPQGSGGLKFDKFFLLDMARIGSDAIIGIIISLALFATTENYLLIASGAILGILPDALQFLYSKFKHEPLVSLQKFHLWIHHGKKIDSPLRGISSQILIIAITFFSAKYLVKVL